MERWKLGYDQYPEDAVFDPITYQQIIDAVHHGCRDKNPEAVRRTAREILNQRLEDYWFLIENNMQEIINAAEPNEHPPLMNHPNWDSERLEALAQDIYQWLLEHEMWIDVAIYYDGKRMSTSRKVGDEWEFRYNGEPFIEDGFDPRDYFEYVAKEHIASLSFEGALYDLINYQGGRLLQEFNKLISKHGLMYELGDAWNMTLYEA